MSGLIVTIGGGELKDRETIAIDRYIAEAAGNNNPLALFIPTASGEPEGYISNFNDVYGNELGCKTDTLRILSGEITDSEIACKIMDADLIYVGGGNTKMMMEKWRERGIGKLLLAAHEKGTVLSGLSAGAICWYEAGHSDSDYTEAGKFITVSGLGLIPAFHCPHYNERPEFDDYLQRHVDGPAVVIEDNCAVAYLNGKFRIIKSSNSANAYSFTKKDGKYIKKILTNTEFLPFDELFS